MSSTFLSLHYHIVFSTKDRWPFIQPDWINRCHTYLGGTIRGLNGVAEAVGGIDDHVHLLVGLRATHRLSDFVCEVKKASSFWAIEHYERRFRWQEGYAAFSVSSTARESVSRYIFNQAEHHRTITFTDELRQMLRDNDVPYDPKYLE